MEGFFQHFTACAVSLFRVCGLNVILPVYVHIIRIAKERCNLPAVHIVRIGCRPRRGRACTVTVIGMVAACEVVAVWHIPVNIVCGSEFMRPEPVCDYSYILRQINLRADNFCAVVDKIEPAPVSTATNFEPVIMPVVGFVSVLRPTAWI